MSYNKQLGQSALDVIEHRRTIKPEQFDGTAIPNELIETVLAAGNWAPTHGYTEPWRFFVFSGETLTAFCERILEATAEKSGESVPEVAANKLRERLARTSHLVVITMQRGDNPKIPAEEELMATACAVQNIWLAASAFGIAGYWNSGGLKLEEFLKDDFGLRPDDRILGFMYFGNTSSPWPSGKRMSDIKAKTTWL